MRRRAGFTLVELLVAMTLTIFVMVILSQTFIIAVDVFSGLKGIGDLQERLRIAAATLRNDLSQNHFEGNLLLSDPLMLQQRPSQGFFRVYNGTASNTAPNTPEGTDADGLASSVANN